MSRWSTDAETRDRRIARALIVREFGPAESFVDAWQQLYGGDA